MDGDEQPGPRWLTEEEQAAWRAFITLSQRVRRECERQLLADSEMGLTHYGLLVSLSEAPLRTLRMSDLAQASDASQSQVSHAVAKMEARGWIQRRPCPTDRRGFNAILTDAGLEALRRAAPGHVERVREVLIDVLTPQQLRQLREVAEAALAHAIPNAVEAAYRRTDLFEKRRMLMSEWASFLERVPAAAGDVVPIRGGR